MAANFSFIAHAAQRNTSELASQGASDRATQRGFSHARRADKAQNLSLALASGRTAATGAQLAQLAHGQKFYDALFDTL